MTGNTNIGILALVAGLLLAVVTGTAFLPGVVSAADADGDGINDSEDAYPSYAKQSYTVNVTDNKTASSVYAEINSTNEVTVTVLANSSEVGSKTVTPSETPRTVEVAVSDDGNTSSYTVEVHGVNESDVSSTGVFYESADSGGAGGDAGSDLTGTLSENPFLALITVLVAGGAIAVIREEL